MSSDSDELSSLAEPGVTATEGAGLLSSDDPNAAAVLTLRGTAGDRPDLTLSMISILMVVSSPLEEGDGPERARERPPISCPVLPKSTLWDRDIRLWNFWGKPGRYKGLEVSTAGDSFTKAELRRGGGGVICSGAGAMASTFRTSMAFATESCLSIFFGLVSVEEGTHTCSEMASPAPFS